MPAVTDEQVLVLETYLDGELSRDEAAAVDAQLASDAMLMQTLIALRAERSLRLDAFAAIEAIEPRSGSHDLMAAVHRAATREQVWQTRSRHLRQYGAAAACILVGLSVGWFGRGKMNASNVSSSTTAPPRAINQPANQPAPSNVVTAANSNVTQPGVPYAAPGNPGVQLVSDGNSTRIVPRVNGFNVSITDDLGRVLGVQHFDTLDEARKFSNDFSAWQNKQRQLRDSKVKLVGDEF